MRTEGFAHRKIRTIFVQCMGLSMAHRAAWRVVRNSSNRRRVAEITVILACDKAGITITLPKPMTSNSKAEGRFGKQDFRYVVEEDVYVCPTGERLSCCLRERVGFALLPNKLLSELLHQV
jgi:hypothetical protein